MLEKLKNSKVKWKFIKTAVNKYVKHRLKYNKFLNKDLIYQSNYLVNLGERRSQSRKKNYNTQTIFSYKNLERNINFLLLKCRLKERSH